MTGMNKTKGLGSTVVSGAFNRVTNLVRTDPPHALAVLQAKNTREGCPQVHGFVDALQVDPTADEPPPSVAPGCQNNKTRKQASKAR